MKRARSTPRAVTRPFAAAAPRALAVAAAVVGVARALPFMANDHIELAPMLSPQPGPIGSAACGRPSAAACARHSGIRWNGCVTDVTGVTGVAGETGLMDVADARSRR